MTTVELIVDEQPWAPRPDATPDTAVPLPRPANPSDLVALRIAAHELVLRTRVKGAGGKWDVTRQVWILPLRLVRVLALEDRIRKILRGLS